MKLIQRFEVSRFRSIRTSKLEDLGNFSVLVGINNSGKSNFLRALSAFFTNQPDANVPLDVDSDYYRPELRAKKKKKIQIKVHFKLPPEFKFRKKLEAVEQLLTREFAIAKEWERGEVEPKVFLNDDDQPLTLADRDRVGQFLSLISFRYVPNRVLPLDVVKHEHQALRDVLIRRLGRAAVKEGAIFETMAQASGKLIGTVSQEVHNVFRDVADVRLATPASLTEMVFSFGYRLNEAGLELEDTVQGSGLQSFLMFHTLNLIDRDYFQKFGWRQAAIWAVEEPESSLHLSLEATTAALLRDIAAQDRSRLQVVATTHSDLMVQYGDKGYYVEKGSGGTTATAMAPPTLIEKAAKLGVSRWVHPILYHPLMPLLLVEGEQDENFFKRSFQLLGKDGMCAVAFLGRLTGEPGAGGVQALYDYVRQNKKAIKSRPKNAPVVVVLDWDAKTQRSKFQRLFATDDPFAVLVWPEEQANPKLSKGFHGYERFLSDRLIGVARGKGAKIGKIPKGQYVVESHEYGSVKKVLAGLVNEDLRRADLIHSERFLASASKALRI